jgi:hypothetical protein
MQVAAMHATVQMNRTKNVRPHQIMQANYACNPCMQDDLQAMQENLNKPPE